MANSVGPDQTAPIGAVCSGSRLFASILSSSVMLGNYLQQMRVRRRHFQMHFFLGPLRVNSLPTAQYAFLCMLIFQNHLFQKFFLEYHQSIKQFGFRCFVWADLGPNILQRLSADVTRRHRVKLPADNHHIIIRLLINVQVQGHHPHQCAPFPGNWLAARIADLTPDLQVLLL